MLVLYKFNPFLNSGLYLAEIRESIDTSVEGFVGFKTLLKKVTFNSFLLSRSSPGPLCPQLLLLWFSGLIM